MTHGRDTAQLFIDNIFTNLNPEEHILCWASAGQSPGFPTSTEHFFNKSLRSPKPKACYFSTATALMDDGRLFNRQALFSRMWCIVLDDIGVGTGAKCGIDDLPEAMREEYSWRIESSPGNYQYGYILDTPIDDLPAAKDLVKLIYNAGSWDSGGAMPNKLVRLPVGVNIKKKYAEENNGELWNVRLDGEVQGTWTPDELLDAVSAGVTWADVQSGAAGKLDPRRGKGTTAWRHGVQHENLEGVVDEVLEWLNVREDVVNENGDWLDIICPQCEDHSEGGGNTAGYKPLGHGTNPERRGFHCFHDNCKGYSTAEFLAWVAKEGGPVVPVVDPVPALLSRWAVDIARNEFIDMRGERPERVPNAGFKLGHQRPVFWTGANGKPAKASEYALITQAPGLVQFTGSKFKPGEPRVIEDGDKLRLNEWSVPNWGSKFNSTESEYTANIKAFTEFFAYLMPHNGDAQWFINHLAAKVQTPTYRGPALILSTPVQGSGRGTMARMMSQLWGTHNVNAVSLSELIGGLSGEGYNDWLQTGWLIVPEAREGNMTRRQEVRAYESLKTGIDPQPTAHVIRYKYGGQNVQDCYGSTIICSNHRDVINIPDSDRRFKYIECTEKVATADYFDRLIHDWLPSDWEPSIWRYLMSIDLDGFSGSDPQNIGLTKAQARERTMQTLASQSVIDRLVTICLMFCDENFDGVVSSFIIQSWVDQYAMQLGVAQISGWEDIFKRSLQNSSAQIKTATGDRARTKINGQNIYYRQTLKSLASSRRYDLHEVKDMMVACDANDLRVYVEEVTNECFS